MKKIYQMPAVKVVEETTETFIAASPNVTVDSSAAPVEAATVESRRFTSVWDDEEE